MTQITVACCGELLLRLSSPNGQPLLHTGSLDWHVGGAEANVAVGLSHLGLGSRMISTVADNRLGEVAIEALRQHGVDTSGVRKRAGRMGLYFHTSGAGLRSGSVLYDRAGSAFASAAPNEYDPEKLLAGCHWLHLSGVTPAVGEHAAELACSLAEAAVAGEIPVSFDFNYRPSLWGLWNNDPTPYLQRLVSSATLLFANDHDLAMVLGGDVDSAGRSLDLAGQALDAFEQLQGVMSAFRTAHSVEHQSLKAELVTRAGRCQTESINMHEVIDRIGAGDAFASAAIEGWVTGRDPEALLQRALSAAVLKHSISGDFPVTSAAELDQYLSHRGSFDVKR